MKNGKLRIGLVGYFGWGNFGDELFLKIFKDLFFSHDLVLFHTSSGFLPNVDELIGSVDVIIIGGGDLLMPYYQSWLYWDKRYLSKPVFIYGVGVPTWGGVREEVIDHYKFFLNHKNIKMISCRDYESAKWLREFIDPSQEISCHPDIVASYEIAKQTNPSNSVCLILRKQEHYHKHYLNEVYKLVLAEGMQFKLLLLGTDQTLIDDYDSIHSFQFPKCDIIVRNEIDDLVAELCDNKVVISMKFHGIVCAYLSNTPFVSLSRADKFVSFCKETQNEHLLCTWDSETVVNSYKSALNGHVNFTKRNDIVSAGREGLERLKFAVYSTLF